MKKTSLDSNLTTSEVVSIEKPTLLEDLFQAYFDARKSKRNTKTQLKFEFNLEQNLIELFEEVRDRIYTPSPSICFMIEKPVKREVFTSQFRDKVVYRLLYNYLLPVFERRAINDCYAVIKGRGTSYGIDRIDHHIRSCTHNYTRDAYIMKLDLKGYFVNINREILYGIVEKGLEKHWERRDIDGIKFGDHADKETILFLLKAILSKNPTDDLQIRGNMGTWRDIPPSKRLTKAPRGIGLPVGDVTSQLFSNIYMGVFDEHIKHDLKIKHYGRYVDDFYFIHQSKTFLTDLLRHCKQYLNETLGIEIHPNKIYLQHYTKGVKFLGAVIKPHRRYADNKSVKEFRKTVKSIEKVCDRYDTLTKEVLFHYRSKLNSYCGYLTQFKSHKIFTKLFDDSPIKKHFVFDENFKKVMPHPKYKKTVLKKVQKEKNLSKILSV